jgi:pimeloyl-ACP methyl ester carboxylesterase
MMRLVRRCAAPIVLLLICVLASTQAAEAGEGPRGYTGTIGGAEFRVEVPAHWNGNLVLYSHPYYTPDIPPGIGFSTRAETGDWLLEHGYALAASDFKGRYGWAVEDALEDQVALLDWFESHVGRPRHVVATGTSMGGLISVVLAERHPERIDGVLSMSAPLDMREPWNLFLDVTFAVKVLLAPGEDIDLVRPSDAAGSTQALLAAVNLALETPEGRARLALANAFGNIEGWSSSLEPKPAALDQIRALAQLDQFAVIGGFGPVARPDLERRAGGNPSWNTGIDYRLQLARSEHRELVLQAYTEAGLDLEEDLATLAAAPRIAADPAAVRYVERYGVPRGTTPAPVLTMHNVSDVSVPSHERWYAEQVRGSGDPRQLRQVYLGRSGHGAFSAAEEITGMCSLLQRVETGRWPSTQPSQLNAAAISFPEPYLKVFDFATFRDVPVPPAFTHHRPGLLPR